MSADLAGIAARLRELADQLRDPSLEDERAEELAREAAELASRAGTEAETALRESAGDADEQ
ncbi:MAG: hypothetical protein ACRDL1_02230 [Solirubrobacterales bacterium]